jgi:hypothetical protein
LDAGVLDTGDAAYLTVSLQPVVDPVR